MSGCSKFGFEASRFATHSTTYSCRVIFTCSLQASCLNETTQVATSRIGAPPRRSLRGALECACLIFTTKQQALLSKPILNSVQAGTTLPGRKSQKCQVEARTRLQSRRERSGEMPRSHHPEGTALGRVHSGECFRVLASRGLHRLADFESPCSFGKCSLF